MKFLNKNGTKAWKICNSEFDQIYYYHIYHRVCVEFDAACIFFSDSVFSGTGSCTDSAWTDLEAGELGLIPPGQLNIFTLIMLLCYYQLGTALERTWGAFRYNVYIFSDCL